MLKLFLTPALPLHYIAEDIDGSRWIIPASPIAPESRERWTAYHGNYTLTRLPAYIEKFYQPAEAV
jgi:hypothetical protein